MMISQIRQLCATTCQKTGDPPPLMAWLSCRIPNWPGPMASSSWDDSASRWRASHITDPIGRAGGRAGRRAGGRAGGQAGGRASPANWLSWVWDQPGIPASQLGHSAGRVRCWDSMAIRGEDDLFAMGEFRAEVGGVGWGRVGCSWFFVARWSHVNVQNPIISV